jgi:hypothetical protein
MGYRIYWEDWMPAWQVVGALGVATIDPGRLNQARWSAERLLALAGNSHTSGRPPRRSDPAVAALLDKIFDFSAFGSEALDYGETTRAIQWFNAADRVGLVYILAGTGVTDMAKLANDLNEQNRTHRNVAAFAPEMAQFLDFQIVLLHALARANISHMAFAAPAQLESEDFRKTLAEVRSTTVRTIIKVLTSLTYGGLTADWRRERLAMLNATAPNLAQVLLPEDAEAIREFALKATAYLQDAALKAEVTAYANAIAQR